jgi:hypothetical protein
MSLEVLKNVVNVFRSQKLLRTPIGNSLKLFPTELRTYDPRRRLFLRWLLGLPFLFSFPFHIREAAADPPTSLAREGRGSISHFFKGEELVYEIGFWFFKRAAIGKLNFYELEKKGYYMAVLQAETLGVLGWVTRYRQDTYRSTMVECDEGRRFKSLSFEENAKIGNKLRKRIHHFDYQEGKWIQLRLRKDGSMARTEAKIPPGMVYDDFLAASFNFRYGVYGEIERGKKYTIATFPRKGSSSYEVNVARKEEEEKRKRSEKSKDGKDFYVKLYLDPEITHSKEGLIEGWLSKELYPIAGVIKDVDLFGDVKGTLVKKRRE